MKHSEKGFSFVDVIIAVTIVLVGVLALSGAMSVALLRTQDTEEQLRAQQVVTSTLESIFSVRDLKTLTWEKIAYTTDPTPGVFVAGVQPVYDGPGPDGIVGTADDATGTTVVPTYTREIVITPVLDPDLLIYNAKRVLVRVNYKVGGGNRSEEIETWLTNYKFNS